VLLTPCHPERRATHESRPHIGYSLVDIIIFLSGIVCELRHGADVMIKCQIGKGNPRLENRETWGTRFLREGWEASSRSRRDR
jgi:hypothetical protein